MSFHVLLNLLNKLSKKRLDEQFIHHTWINLRSNLKFLSTQQHAY